MRPRLAAASLLSVIAGSCRFGAAVEVTPIEGLQPETVAIWPFAEGGTPADAEVWFTGLADQLGRRGYRVVAPGVAREVLMASELGVRMMDTTEVGRALNADALLVLELRSFEARGRKVLREASWDVAWSLVSARGQGRQWQHATRGSWRQADLAPLESLSGFDEVDDPRPIVPLGGSRVPSFRDVPMLVAHLHRDAMEHLPARAAR